LLNLPQIVAEKRREKRYYSNRRYGAKSLLQRVGVNKVLTQWFRRLRPAAAFSRQ